MSPLTAFKTAWLTLDPDQLEQAMPVRDGCVQFDDVGAAAPLLEEAFFTWGAGVTVSEAGIPLRDWRHFLHRLRREREMAASTQLALGVAMSEVERVIAKATAVFDDPVVALTWLDAPLEVFQGCTPRELLTQGRAGDVLSHLTAIESGHAH